jgi:hypothetical protein
MKTLVKRFLNLVASIDAKHIVTAVKKVIKRKFYSSILTIK